MKERLPSVSLSCTNSLAQGSCRRTLNYLIRRNIFWWMCLICSMGVSLVRPNQSFAKALYWLWLHPESNWEIIVPRRQVVIIRHGLKPQKRASPYRKLCTSIISLLIVLVNSSGNLYVLYRATYRSPNKKDLLQKTLTGPPLYQRRSKC